MIHALHGNMGLPDDVSGLLSFVDRPFHAWHLWRRLKERPQSASLGSFATELNDAVEEESVRPRVLLGYSLGGRLALHALTRDPDKWDSAVIISAHPGFGSHEERAARLAQDHSWAERILHEPWPDVMAAWNAQPLFSNRHAGRDAELETWRREISRAFDAWSLGRQADLRSLLPSVKCPVLWLTGERDAKFTALAAEACSLMPCARHLIVTDAGHRVHLDRPAAVADEIRSFLVTAGC